MKIVCDSCGAKYSIADEKVAGKIFKIRCKKCASVLEVRGDQTGAQALEPTSQGPSQEAGWYVVVDGEQRGPLAPIELSQLFAKGSVGLDSYVWKEGFDDWKIASDVPELVEILGGIGSAARGETAKIPTEDSARFGTGGDLFADGNGREPTGEVEPERGVFDDPEPAAAAASEEASEGPAAEAGQAAAFGAALGGGGAPAEPARMTGQRNENSVLFSLSNLQQLASRGGGGGGGGEVSAQPAQAQPAGPQAAGEGSGLIDIRALAKSTTPGTKTAPSQAVDDLLAIGTSASAGTLGGPLLGPTPIETASGNRWLWVAGIAVAVVGIVGIGIGLGVALRSSSEDDAIEVAAAEPVTPPGESPAGAAPVPSEGSEQAQQVEDPALENTADLEDFAEEPLEAPEFNEEPEAQQARPAPKQRASSRRRRSRPPSQRAAGSRPEPPKQRNTNNLDALMDEVVGGSKSKPQASASKSNSRGGSSLPDSPSRNDVKTALQGVSGGVKACHQGTSGTAVVDVTFSGSTGRVSRAKVASGPFKGTAVGACVEKAVRRARVPRFKQSSFKVKFPYRL